MGTLNYVTVTEACIC